MKVYPKQPETAIGNIDEIRETINTILEESLPECSVNEWFVTTVHYANMLDKIMEKLKE